MWTASPSTTILPLLVATISLPTMVEPFVMVDGPPRLGSNVRPTTTMMSPASPPPQPPTDPLVTTSEKEWPVSPPITNPPPPPPTTCNSNKQQPRLSSSDLPPMVQGSSLLEGRWELTSSNDVGLKHPLLVEIHGDQSFNLLGRKREFAFSLRFRQSGKFHLLPATDDDQGPSSSLSPPRGGVEDAMAEGQLVLYPQSEHLESVAGVALPVPEPLPPSADITSSSHGHGGGKKRKKKEGSNGSEKRIKTRRVRVVMENRDTLILVFQATSKFYVLQRASGATGSDDHPTTPIYVLVTTNILGWVVSNLLAVVGDDLSHLSHLPHLFK